ncbi:MAG: bifunctional riboflavin kinase/FAD synthetase [Alphaproteobacteria bacterium]|nr:bifunctional riboflavin kinase/FAD synthetase [Alphaproteobacteria bacterium]
MTAFSLLRSLDSVPPTLRGGVVAIGNFDGCHRGHQHVFRAARALSDRTGRPLIMLTFEPHPRDVFAPEPFMFRLTDGEQKARLAAAFGFSAIAIMPFSRTLAAVEAEEFVKTYFVEALEASAVVVGADFHFGRARAGTPAFLRDAGNRHGFEVHQLDLIGEAGETISSSLIREALEAGDVTSANTLFGYHWIIEGTVIMGDQRGRTLGFPTANFSLPANSRLAEGVYAVRVKLGNRRFDGVAGYGKPMFDNTQPPFEAHILDFDEDIYGAHIEVALVCHLRENHQFNGVGDLIAQMNRDKQRAREIVTAARPISDLDRHLGFISRGQGPEGA